MTCESPEAIAEWWSGLTALVTFSGIVVFAVGVLVLLWWQNR